MESKMKKLGLSLLALAFSFALVSQANAQCCSSGCAVDCNSETPCGNCTCTCAFKRYRAIPYCVTKYYQEPYCVQKQCCTQVPQYYQVTCCKMVPQYYQVTKCRMVPQPYTVCETKYRTKSYCEQHCTYQPYIIYKTFQTPCGNVCGGCGSCGGCAPACAPCCGGCNGGCCQ
jgi:hypothetical protein